MLTELPVGAPTCGMPEGDTIHRAARTLGQWLAGRTITAAQTVYERVALATLVGQTVTGVEARAKHLLIRFSSGAVLHTHMRMTGSWHVYSAGERWRRPGHQARVILEAGDRVAVGFNVPVVELLDGRSLHRHPALSRLGPDVLARPVDHDEVGRRAATSPPDAPIGDVLLTQSVVGGIGNIWRCETLFLNRVDPWEQRSDVPPETLRRLVETASDLMAASVGDGGPAPRPRPWVYGRRGRPCRRCGTLIQSAAIGRDARTVYWCPACQRPARPAGHGR